MWEPWGGIRVGFSYHPSSDPKAEFVFPILANLISARLTFGFVDPWKSGFSGLVLAPFPSEYTVLKCSLCLLERVVWEMEQLVALSRHLHVGS